MGNRGPKFCRQTARKAGVWMISKVIPQDVFHKQSTSTQGLWYRYLIDDSRNILNDGIPIRHFWVNHDSDMRCAAMEPGWGDTAEDFLGDLEEVSGVVIKKWSAETQVYWKMNNDT